MLCYIIQVQSRPPEEVIRILSVEVGPEMEKIMTSTYDQLINRGRDEGRAEGRAEIALQLLTARFHTLSETIIERVRGASAEQLERWALKILDSKTLEEVFDPQ